MIHTCPFAFSVPRIWEGFWLPVTRLSAMELLDGCSNCVISPGAMSKLLQLMIARLLLCVTVSVLPELLMFAAPPTTCPPVGLA